MKNIFLFTVLLSLISCSRVQNNPSVETGSQIEKVKLSDEQFKNSGIVLGELRVGKIHEVFKASGKIEVPPQNIVSISVPLGGYLKSTKLLPGMHVAKGETLAIIEDLAYVSLQQEYLNARATLSLLEEDYNRQKELNTSKASSEKTLQEASTRYVNQKVAVKALAEKLLLIGINPDKLNETNLSRSIPVCSPINGFVAKVNVNVGKYTNPSDVLFELVNPDDIHLALNVFEKDVDKLFIGQKLVAYSNNYPDRKFPCEVILVAKNFSDDKSVMVHCHFDKYHQDLIPGMFMNAELDIPDKQGLLMPSSAIVQSDGKSIVFYKTERNEFIPEEVNVLSTVKDTALISFATGFTTEGKQFVLKGSAGLMMKLKSSGEE